MVPWCRSTAAGWGAEVNALRCALLILLLGAMGADRSADGTVRQRIFIVGDSTASYYGPERAPRTGWGQVLGDYFDASVEVRNHAQSGRSSRSFIEQGFFGPIMRDLGTGDLLLIQFGHNDEKIDDTTRYNEPVEAFPRWLMHYIDLARERGATPVLITPVARRLFDEGRLVDTHGLYAESVRKLAAAQRVALFDLGARSMRLIAALGEDASKHFYLYDAAAGIADNTHFSRHGASAIACLVAGDLLALRSELAAHTRRDTACGADTVAAGTATAEEAPAHPAIVEHQESLALTQPGPHGGAGSTTAYNYFREAPALGLTFRKRVLHRGASIGPHRNNKDEIFYVIGGEGLALVDGSEHRLRAGDALLSRTGGMHAIHQVGDSDLELIVVYQPLPSPPAD
jgi:lysophospholipase L1-like esterase/quercetin dioxygenase-like cupin family protein